MCVIEKLSEPSVLKRANVQNVSFLLCTRFYVFYWLSPLGTSKAQQELKAIGEKSTKQNEHLHKPGKGLEA